MYILVNQLSNMDCHKFGQYVFQGTKIFENSVMTQPASILTISGWIFLRGDMNKYYTIFTILEGSSTALSLSYNLVIKTIKMISFGQESPLSISNLAKNEWIFFYSTVEYDNGTNNFIAKTFIFSSTFTTLLPNLSNTLSPVHFVKDQIKVSIGIPGNIINVEPSCSFIKQFTIYWDLQIAQNNIGSIINDISSFQSRILWYFDFFYSKMNPGYLLSYYENNIVKLNLVNDMKINNIVQDNEVFFNDLINISESNGFTLSFDFFIEPPKEPTSLYVLIIRFSDLSSLSLYIQDNIDLSIAYLKTPSPSFIGTGQIVVNKWMNVRIIVKNGYQNQFFILLDSENSAQQLITIPKPITAPLAQIQFGKNPNKRIFKLNNIIVVKGTMLQTNPGCQLQTYSVKNEQDCIICNHFESMDIENGACVPTTSITLDPESYYRRQRTRLDCKKDMVEKSGVCVCSDQFYLENDKCIRCPYYCDGCINQNTCIKADQFREMNGKCKLDKFDDGFSCLQQQKDISQNKLKKYKVNYFNPSFVCDQTIDVSFSYTFTGSQFNFSTVFPFLYTFTFSITDLTQTVGVISVVSDFNNGEIFTISYDNSSISFLLLGFQTFNKIQINPKETFQIGVWTNWQIVILFVYNNSQIIQSEAFFSLGQPVMSLKICVGPCISQYVASYLCGDLKDRQFTVVKNIPYSQIKLISADQYLLQAKQYPKYNEIIGQVIASDYIRLAYFKTKFTLNQQIQQFYDENNLLDFYGSLSKISGEMGFLFTKQTFAKLTIPQQYNFPFTISMYLYIQEMRKSTTLIKYEMNGYQILYQLQPLNSNTLFSVRICIDIICQDTTYAKLYINNPNHLMIVTRNKSTFSKDIYLLQFEIVCNYMRESLNFMNKLKPIDPKNSINIGDSSNIDQVNMYINKIQLYTGDGAVSFNTDNQDYCFIYSDIEQSSCIFPKRGFVIFESNPTTHLEEIISIDQCYQKNELLNTGIYTYKINTFLNECTTTCKYPHTDYNKNCECIEGYYSEKTEDGQSLCSKCSDKCQTCKGTKDNCLTCKISHLNGPDCNCIEANTYLDTTTKTCSPCSNKCLNCVENQDNCLSCSETRISPPFCFCDQRYYKQDGDDCIKLECSGKCKECENSPENCTLCKSGRYSPPDCLCQENYQQISTGECIPCPPSTYYEQQSNNCLPCEKPCSECYKNKNNCTSCIDGFNIDNFVCLCENGKAGKLQENGDIECMKDIDAIVNLDNKGNYYEFTFIFNIPIKEISQLKLGNYIDILDFYIAQIDKKYYTLIDFIFNGNQITAKLKINSNFSATQAILAIQQTELFQSIDGKSNLSEKYKNLPFNFDIGPHLFKEDDLSNKNMDNAIDFLKNQNSDELKFLQQLQLVLYLLNTVQPSSLFLLLQAQLPPHLYKFCQIFALLIFPSVADYQSHKIQEEYTLFGLDLNKQEVYPDCQFGYSRLGFSNSLLINIPIIIIKYIIIVSLILSIKLLTLTSFKLSNKPIFNKIRVILIQRLNTENEINLLLTTLSILLQFRCIDQNSFASRYGLYLAIGFLIYLLTMSIFNYRLINSDNSVKQQNQYNQLENEENDQTIYSILFTDRIEPTETNKYKRNYFFMQLLKKYLQILILFIFYPYPYFAAPLCGVLLLLSSISTMILKPYISLRSRIIKTFGEILLSVCWFLCIFFPNIEDQFQKNNIIDDKLFQKYIKIGTIIIYLILGFNILFVIEFICSIISTIAKLFNKNQESIQQQQQYQFQHPKLFVKNTKIK